ncbi:glycine betaine ABC transporter substrate-binding protein [Weissella kandleri]|uniref:glycine betaine ABC transporter substrate-binding protein n=1 Tax=Weissella kandleri TaxID=1616 RepID=UPI00387E59BC
MRKMKIILPLLVVFILIGIGLMNTSTKAPDAYNPNKALGPQVDYTITGIDAGAGIMNGTNTALDSYGLRAKNWQLQTSSTAAMTSSLGKAVAHHEPIVVTGWVPHWMVSKYNLKFLDDPKGVYGKAENINTIARKGLKESDPEAYTVLDRFHWTPDEMAKVMMKVNEGVDPQKAAQEWLAENPDQLKAWTDSVDKVSGKKLTLTYVAWDSEIASTNVVAQALRDVGYDVTIRPMEIQPLWASVSTGAADAMVSAWLPNTSGKYYDDYKGKFDDLGANLEGARVGLCVPKYMSNINSIEDLKR